MRHVRANVDDLAYLVGLKLSLQSPQFFNIRLQVHYSRISIQSKIGKALNIYKQYQLGQN